MLRQWRSVAARNVWAVSRQHLLLLGLFSEVLKSGQTIPLCISGLQWCGDTGYKGGGEDGFVRVGVESNYFIKLVAYTQA